jgi:hypothetical protein
LEADVLTDLLMEEIEREAAYVAWLIAHKDAWLGK